MNEIRTLMEKFWICRDSDKETFYKVKRDIPNFQRFIREQLGWKLIHTEKLLKLEKRPAHAEAFMGINEFTDIRDYCILCVVLMYLEDAEEGRQFLLSELIDYVETQLKNYMPVDWTSFTQRKSLVRVLQYMERLQMLRVYEGKSETFSQEAGQEVLYENTGYLFLEFWKEDSGEYRTIGIGQKAKRGKPMDFWGFVILDGRRVGYDLCCIRKWDRIKFPGISGR